MAAFYDQFPEWYKRHQGRLKEIGKCDITECRCHAVDAAKDPNIRKQWNEERLKWFIAYGYVSKRERDLVEQNTKVETE